MMINRRNLIQTTIASIASISFLGGKSKKSTSKEIKFVNAMLELKDEKPHAFILYDYCDDGFCIYINGIDYNKNSIYRFGKSFDINILISDLRHHYPTANLLVRRYENPATLQLNEIQLDDRNFYSFTVEDGKFIAKEQTVSKNEYRYFYVKYEVTFDGTKTHMKLIEQ